MDTASNAYRPLRFLSLCSGIGGIDLAAIWAGMEVVGQVEIDPYCQAVLEKQFPDVKRLSDIRGMQGDEFGYIDIMAAGFPCQPHSLAGKRQASKDERDLWPEIRRLIGTIKPRWFVGENVYGLLTTESARFFGSILRDLDSLGYRVFWSVYGACDIGAPHRRERVFIVAHSCQPRTWMEEHRSGGQGGQHSDSPESALVRQELRTIGSEGIGAGSPSSATMADTNSIRCNIGSNHRQGRSVQNDLCTTEEVQQERQGWVSWTSLASPTLADSNGGNGHRGAEPLNWRSDGVEMGSITLADPQSVGSRSRGSERESGRETLSHGTSTSELAYPSVEGLEGQQRQELQGTGMRPANSSEVVGYPSGTGCKEQQSTPIGRPSRRPAWTDDTDEEYREIGRSPESQLCRGADGLPRTLDIHRWPTTPDRAQEEWEPPRVIKRGQEPYRNRRLEALGNAVVPQHIYPVLKAIADIEIEMAREEVAS